MNSGQFAQVDTPARIYEYPQNRFIADFIGSINLLEARVIAPSNNSRDDLLHLHCDKTGTELAAHRDNQTGDETHHEGARRWVAIRPEKIFIDKEPPSAKNRTVLRGVVLDLGYFGNLSVYPVQLPSGLVLKVSAQSRHRSATHTVEWDDELFLSWDIASAILLSE